MDNAKVYKLSMAFKCEVFARLDMALAMGVKPSAVNKMLVEQGFAAKELHSRKIRPTEKGMQYVDFGNKWKREMLDILATKYNITIYQPSEEEYKKSVLILFNKVV